ARAAASAQEAVRVLAAREHEAGFTPELVLARLHLAEITLAQGHADTAAAQLAQADADLPGAFGANSAEAADAARVPALLQLAHGEAAAAQAASERGLAIVRTLDPAAPRVEIGLLEVHAAALAAQARHDAARIDIGHALDVLKAAQPDARLHQTALLAQ